MKKLALATLVVSGIVFLGVNTTDAESHHMKGKKMSEKSGMEGMHSKMMEKHMSEKKMPGMMGGMMMNKKKVVPTEDGGVLVMMGNKLYKYNKKLEKIGETTIEISEEDMEKRMKHMKKMREKCMEMWEEKEEDEEDEE